MSGRRSLLSLASAEDPDVPSLANPGSLPPAEVPPPPPPAPPLLRIDELPGVDLPGLRYPVERYRVADLVLHDSRRPDGSE